MDKSVTKRADTVRGDAEEAPLFSSAGNAKATPSIGTTSTLLTAVPISAPSGTGSAGAQIIPQTGAGIPSIATNDTTEKTQTTRITNLTLEMTKADAPAFKAAIQYYEDGLEVFWQYITLMDKSIKRHVKDVEGLSSQQGFAVRQELSRSV